MLRQSRIEAAAYSVVGAIEPNTDVYAATAGGAINAATLIIPLQ